MNARQPITAFVAVLAVCASTAHAAAAATDSDSQTPTASGKSVEVTIYPVLGRAPIFGATVNLPSVPTTPGLPGGDEGGSSSEDTDVSLNGAYMAGALVESKWWFAEAYGTWAALSASRSTPRLNVDSNTYLFTARGGVRLIAGLGVTAGVRRVRTDITATVTLPNLNRTAEASTSPALWDPLVGVDWRPILHGRLMVDANVTYGGFGVGTDRDVSADARVRWRFVPHVELRAGYSYINFKETVKNVQIGSLSRTLVIQQSLNGPELGIGIVF